MKKMILGITWQAIGSLGALLILCTAAPLLDSFNGRYYGLVNNLSDYHLMLPLIACTLLFFAGLVLYLWDNIQKAIGNSKCVERLNK